MYLPTISGLDSDVVHPRSIITSPTPFDTSRFTLDISGVMCFIGGDVAICVMATIPIYKGLRWAGWYNTAGSYQIARQYALATAPTLLKGFFQGPRSDVSTLFQFSGQQGPRFQSVRSGTVMDSSGHLASLLMRQCASQKVDKVVSRRDGPGVTVSIVDLNLKPIYRKEFDPPRLDTSFPFLAIVPIVISAAACAGSAVFRDWFSFSLILWGMLSNGLCSVIIGSGSLHFKHHIPSAGSPPGDGILGFGREFVVLQGDESSVNAITSGRFYLKFPEKLGDHRVGFCSILFFIQFITQLFLIPQASLFGQIMFVSSLTASCVYNSWFASRYDEEVRGHAILNGVLSPERSSRKYSFPTRTSAVVFALCALLRDDLRELSNNTSLATPTSTSISTSERQKYVRRAASEILNAFLPNKTKVWETWKENRLNQLSTTGALELDDQEWRSFGSPDDKLLETLCRDAVEAYDTHNENR